jgi:hypothetical protein
MVKSKTRVEKIVANLQLQGVAKDCFTSWKKALVSYQKTSKLPDTMAKQARLARQYTKLEELSWDFIRLTGYKQSVRDAMIWEIMGRGNSPAIAPVQLRVGLGSSTVSLAEYEQDLGLQALGLPLHIVIETNTTIEEVKQFLSTNKRQVNQLLRTRKLGTFEPLRVERDKLILEYGKKGMQSDEIAAEIDSQPKFSALHGEDGISIATVDKVLQRKAKQHA